MAADTAMTISYSCLQGVESMKPEAVERDNRKSDDPSIQQLSSESQLIEMARHSNPVVLVDKLDTNRYI